MFLSNAVYSCAFARNWSAVNMDALCGIGPSLQPDGAVSCSVYVTCGRSGRIAVTADDAANLYFAQALSAPVVSSIRCHIRLLFE